MTVGFEVFVCFPLAALKDERAGVGAAVAEDIDLLVVGDGRTESARGGKVGLGLP